MKKLLILLLLLYILLPVAAYARSPHEDVDGFFRYVPAGDCEQYLAADNLIWRNCTDVGFYEYGTFIGDSTEVYDLIMHGFKEFTPPEPPFPPLPVFEEGWYKGTVTFTGEVDGRTGTMVIMFVGKSPGDIFVWSGTWRIISGSGGLANIHGGGTWENADPEGSHPGYVHYAGEMHFAP